MTSTIIAHTLAAVAFAVFCAGIIANLASTEDDAPKSAGDISRVLLLLALSLSLVSMVVVSCEKQKHEPETTHPQESAK